MDPACDPLHLFKQGSIHQRTDHVSARRVAQILSAIGSNHEIKAAPVARLQRAGPNPPFDRDLAPIALGANLLDPRAGVQLSDALSVGCSAQIFGRNHLELLRLNRHRGKQSLAHGSQKKPRRNRHPTCETGRVSD